MAIVVFIFLIALSLYLAIRSRQGHGTQSVHDFFVASRQFGVFLVFFLAAGEIYSTGAMVGFPGGIYAKGPSYGIWFLGYLMLAYAIGYFLGPKIWSAGKRHNAITLPDLFKGYFENRFLEVVVSASAIFFLLPWGQMQFAGIVSSMKGLGLSFQPLHLIIVAGLLAFTYIAISGVRASAYIAILKDILMVVAIVIVGVAVASEAGVTEVFHAASLHVSNRMSSQQLTFAMSTIFFQALGFYMMPFAVQLFFTAKNADTIRRSQIAMPLYMLMFPFLVLASYYAISQDIKLASPNEAFFAAATHLLPGWLLGLVAAAAALAGLLVLAGICLAIGPIVTRNLLPGLPERKQKSVAKFVIAGYLVASIVMTLSMPNLMLTMMNTTYYGVTQFFPGMMAILFRARIRPAAIAAGILTGQVSAVVMYFAGVDIGGLNLGLVALSLNVLVTGALELSIRRVRVNALS
ncbi:Na+/solute symporter [Burkholderia lata]|uniref:Na+/solute symporter n=1 Tax=Burkholderia lata (strain ATCC 17760 / DSM 23089 / LMG 22485 / NCIMB 9086 / R18194 / 383) TaxID=482957 RepID=A0A6P2UYY4_BURL3|nr:sodium:solute symporter family protein [Burkholderia lata]VWC76030.1 Na+/solute symporter [Burkholderia lata]